MIILVHGAWHGARHWDKVVEALRALGKESIAIDLPGHGARAQLGPCYLSGDTAEFVTEPSFVAQITVEEAARSLLDTLSSLPSGGKPVVVGHSLGGPIVSRAAELEPDLFGHLVYVSGHVPIGLGSPAAYAALPEWRTGYGEDLFVGDPARTGVVRINPKGENAYLERLREAYYNDVPFDEFLPYAQALTPDLPLDFWIAQSRLSPERWGRIPRTYVRCLLDRALAPAIQTRMIAEADQFTPSNQFHVIDLQSSHSPFSSQPDELATVLAKIQSS